MPSRTDTAGHRRSLDSSHCKVYGTNWETTLIPLNGAGSVTPFVMSGQIPLRHQTNIPQGEKLYFGVVDDLLLFLLPLLILLLKNMMWIAMDILGSSNTQHQKGIRILILVLFQ